MASSSGKWTRCRQVLAGEWVRLVMALVCIGILASALVVMVSSAEPGWLTDFGKALKKNPLLFGGLLAMAGVGTLLPIAGAIVKIVMFEQRNREQTAPGE